MKKIIIISNDRLYFNKKEIRTDFNDTINIIESLSKKNFLYFIARKNLSKGIYKTKIQNKSQIKISSIKSLDFKDKKIFMISITPFSFFIFSIINFFHKDINGFVILRSDGFKEYYSKYGFFGKKLYELFFRKILKKLKPIVVTNKLSHISGYKYSRICPSEITSIWDKNLIRADLSKPKLLYVGRIKKEKGIFSLIELVKHLDINFDLNIVGDNKNLILTDNNIKVINETSDTKRLIDFYDKNNIFILPSYTEGYPKVILESLSRLRPVIVFSEIKHVKSKMKGIFVSNRNTKDLKKTIIYILNNYKKIQLDIKKNMIPTKKKFQSDLINIVK
tara:strand:- start:931 stop:1932 length:1002 start_codon:yes stop_codon:yes gene_type:complete